MRLRCQALALSCALAGLATPWTGVALGGVAALANRGAWPDSPPAFASTNLVVFLEPPTATAGSNDWQAVLADARRERLAGSFELASAALATILQAESPEQLKREALKEQALVALDRQDLPRAQQVFCQYLARWPDDPGAPDILLRQGLLYREMGLINLALTKFYAVMTSALVLKDDRLNYYQKLVLQAQVEIAETYAQQGRNLDAAECFGRLLKLESAGLNRVSIQYRLIAALANLGRSEEVAEQAHSFLSHYAAAEQAPEVRYLLASALKRLKRNGEALQQVMFLLQSQQELARQHPEKLAFWQQRTGNEIANQLFQEGDFIRAVEVYLSIAELDHAAAWQLPVWYQIGLGYERLQQPAKALEYYHKIVQRRPESGSPSRESLNIVGDMARWRSQFLTWQLQTETTVNSLKKIVAAGPDSGPDPAGNSPP